LLTGSRQVGKTTLSSNLQQDLPNSIYLNYDTPTDRAMMLAQTWPQRAPLLIFDEVHKMPNWKAWLKGVFDGRANNNGTYQEILVTGSARMDTFGQAGEYLAGRCFSSRLHEVNAMRLFAQTLQQRVGSPLSIASIARDMAVAPKTLTRYLEILEALYIVFTVRPWSRNITRAALKRPKVYFFDTGLVKGDAGVRFENLVACHLLKQVHWRQDALGKQTDLHYIRTKDGAEVDFALSDASGTEAVLTHLIECKLSDAKPHTALKRFGVEQPNALAVQLVRDLRHEQDIQGLHIREAASWLNQLNV
jgi:predicted AAA+ superfamily ATPase